MHHLGRDSWTFWSQGEDGKGGIRDVLLKKQAGGGRDAGSWPPSKTGLAQSGGRLATTSLALLTLEVPLRRLPLNRRDLDPRRQKE